MKKGITILILATLISVASAIAQNIDINASNFPDTNFRNYLLTQPYGSDAILTPAEIAGITNMNVSNMNISDLTGIGFFTALQDLECYNNQLTSLDVSTNTALQSLNCSHNQLTNLDVSGCTALQSLYCYNNQLTSLDVSNNTALYILDFAHNQISPISNLTGLRTDINIFAEGNQLPLSELYLLSSTILSPATLLMAYNKYFTPQIISPQTAEVGVEVDWSPLPAQNFFDGNYTEYIVLMGALDFENPVPILASPAAYTVSNGNITFNTAGTYTIGMSNAAIKSSNDETGLGNVGVLVVSIITVSGEGGGGDLGGDDCLKWAKNFGGISDDNYYSVTAVSDGTVVVGQSFESSFGIGDWTGITGNGGTDAIIVKYDNTGNVVWKKNFGGSDSDVYLSVTAVSDGVVTVGQSETGSFGTGDWTGVTGNGNAEAIIVKYDNDGNVIWKKNFGGSGDDQYSSVIAVSDGIVAAGYSWASSFGNGDWTGVTENGGDDAIIVKYDNSGNIIWKKNFGGSSYDEYRSVIAVSDGIVAVGNSEAGSFGTGDWTGVTGNGSYDAIIVKYDNDGNVVWAKNFGGSGTDYYYSVTQVSDGIVATGWSFLGSFGNGDWAGITGKGIGDAIIVKYDNDGNVVWKKNFGGSNYDYYLSVTTVSDGIVAIGFSSQASFGNGDWTGITGKGDADAIIVKYDNAGNVVRKKNFGGNNGDQYRSVTAVSDGLVAVGIATGFGSGDWTGVTGKGGGDGTIVKWGCYSEPIEDCEPVSNILNLPTCTSIGNMALIGMITPTNATNQNIIWSVTGSGASIGGTNNDILTTTSTGSVTVSATISDGLCGSDYTQDFNINVLEPVTDVTYTPGVASTGNPFTLGFDLSVTPSTVTDYVIAWQVVNAGTTGAKIGGNILKATAGGTVTVRVYVIHNACGHVLFTKDYSITVNDGCCN